MATFTQHFVDILELDKTPLDYMCDRYPDASREEMRRYLGRYGVSGTVQTQVRRLSRGLRDSCTSGAHRTLRVRFIRSH
jgi:ATP-binding cassette subfamily F protein 2